jgi:large subunit ribosomal protein L4
MASTNIYNQQGKAVGTVELSAALFGVEVKPTLVQRVLMALRTNARQVLAHTKGRGEVRGGGRKPWRQKGTGRARQGSIRSPQWIGGGIVFGPKKERSFHVKVNRAVRHQALCMTLSDKAADQKVVVVDTLDLSAPKTKLVYSMLTALPSSADRVLLVASTKNADLYRAARNLPRVEVIDPRSVNVASIVRAQAVVIGQGELQTLTEHFTRS